MKVYVETNPETIYSGRVKDEVKTTEIRMWFETDEEIEVLSLSDYTKQVRKEVLNKIREWHDEECESLDLDSDFDVGYSGALSNLWGILDQIEGKPKD